MSTERAQSQRSIRRKKALQKGKRALKSAHTGAQSASIHIRTFLNGPHGKRLCVETYRKSIQRTALTPASCVTNESSESRFTQTLARKHRNRQKCANLRERDRALGEFARVRRASKSTDALALPHHQSPTPIASRHGSSDGGIRPTSAPGAGRRPSRCERAHRSLCTNDDGVIRRSPRRACDTARRSSISLRSTRRTRPGPSARRAALDPRASTRTASPRRRHHR